MTALGTRLFRIAFIALCSWSLGCSSLLAHQKTYSRMPWESYDDVRAAYASVEVGTTQWRDLAVLGFDPYESLNVDLINYIQVYTLFVPNRGVALDDTDPAVQRCVAARQRCRGLVVDVFREHGADEGSFWLNFLRFRKQTQVTGWVFEALLLVIDDRVEMKLHAGNPRFSMYQDQVRPLGPLQGIDPDMKISFP